MRNRGLIHCQEHEILEKRGFLLNLRKIKTEIETDLDGNKLKRITQFFSKEDSHQKTGILTLFLRIFYENWKLCFLQGSHFFLCVHLRPFALCRTQHRNTHDGHPPAYWNNPLRLWTCIFSRCYSCQEETLPLPGLSDRVSHTSLSLP